MKSTTLKRLFAYPLAQPKAMLTGLLFLFIAALANAGGPWLIQYFIDEHITKDNYSQSVLLTLIASYLGCRSARRSFNICKVCNSTLWPRTSSRPSDVRRSIK